MKEFMEEYGAIVLTIIVIAGMIHGFARIFLHIQDGGV